MDASARSYALDNLRGVMMWLGIVLHVAVNHMVTPTPLPWKDSETSSAADLILLLIHAFRMPVFFILAGFFVARMIEQRGHVGMLRNRLRRIGLPLLLFWPVLAILTGLLALMFVHLMQRGVVGLDPALMPQRAEGQPAIGRLHLWFMFDLLWLYGFSAWLVHMRRFLPVKAMAIVGSAMRRLLSSWWGLLLLAMPLALIGTLYPNGILAPALSFVPNLPELAHHGLFYLAGWAMYTHREVMLPHLEKTCGRYAAIGLVAFMVTLWLLQSVATPGSKVAFPELSIAFFYNCVAWFWSLAMIGAFCKFTRQQTPWLSYLSESSYWVYLVHMLGTIGFGILLYDAPLGWLAKAAINVVATTAACLFSYHAFVRISAIGVLLSGRRF